jgi:hypothetical protein
MGRPGVGETEGEAFVARICKAIECYLVCLRDLPRVSQFV